MAIQTKSGSKTSPREVIERAGIPAEEVEDVVAGCVQQYGEQMFNVGRNAWLQAGLPVQTPATTVDRQCGSAQQAVNFAAALIAAGVHDTVIGSGVEHMGHIPMGVGFKWIDEVGSPFPPELLERYQLVPQGISAEMIAEQWEIPRSEMDELALRSHRLAHRATEEGDHPWLASVGVSTLCMSYAKWKMSSASHQFPPGLICDMKCLIL